MSTEISFEALLDALIDTHEDTQTIGEHKYLEIGGTVIHATGVSVVITKDFSNPDRSAYVEISRDEDRSVIEYASYGRDGSHSSIPKDDMNSIFWDIAGAIIDAT